jgi:hypothetical protein
MRCGAIDNGDRHPAEIGRRKVGDAIADLKVDPLLGA